MNRLELTRNPVFKTVIKSRYPQLTVAGLLLAGYLFAITAGWMGTPVGSANFSIVFVWIAWWALLILLAVPVLGRAWCVVCPIPLPGEWLQRGALLAPSQARPGWLNLRWPKALGNIWLQALAQRPSGGGLLPARNLDDAMVAAMRRPELLARVVVGLLVFAAVGAPLWISSHTPLIHARMADSGGWSIDALRARVGQPLHLRLTSDDVMHGFALGQMSMQGVDVEPGKVSEATVTFDKPGTHTFYRTRWCGINHWRMRGTIEVTGDEPAPAHATVPLFVTLGLNVDAPHDALAIPAIAASPERGSQFVRSLNTAAFTSPDFYRAHSPYQAWQNLRLEPGLASRSDAQLWDIVAFIWESNTTPESLAEGKNLFDQNCAARHGASGRANGVFADRLASAGAGGGVNMMVQRPANLAYPKRMLGASPALLQGKILRGGMGTGMPSWGPIFTEVQTRKIVSYLYTFSIEELGK